MTRIRLVGLTKLFGNTWAAWDVSLDVAEGEFFALLGPSGCGKTTTLRMVAGLERPTSGEVWFGADDVTDLPPQHRNVGLVFQSYAVFPTMTVHENVAYGLRIRRVSRDEIDRRVRAMLEIVGLGALGGRTPGQLSGGQLQRVALARALAIRPQVLLLDEPLSNLDAKLRLDVRAEIKGLQRELGITTLYVTHDQEEALSLSDRIGVMHAGRIEQVGRPEEIYRAPATRFVAGFVGEGTILEGRLRHDSGGGRLVVGERIELPAPSAVHVAPGPVWVCIRPEAVRPVRRSPGDAHRVAGSETTGIAGVVEHLEFIGPGVRADIRVPGLLRPLRVSGSSVDLSGAFSLGSEALIEIDPAGVAIGVLHDAGQPAGQDVGFDPAVGAGRRGAVGVGAR